MCVVERGWRGWRAVSTCCPFKSIEPIDRLVVDPEVVFGETDRRLRSLDPIQIAVRRSAPWFWSQVVQPPTLAVSVLISVCL